MKRVALLSLALAWASVGPATPAKQPAHEFACATDAECVAEYEGVHE